MKMASSSSYYPPCLPLAMGSQEKYDVFLSFRGEDTLNNFTSHLYEALDRKKIHTYMDHRLDKGDEISPALVRAIQESKLSVIIFSKSYANSPWCLNELLRILECRRNNGQLVIPVFYDVDPSHVRKQEGNFGQAFSQLEVRFKETNMDLVKHWRAALEEAANLCGWDATVTRPDSRLVETIVKDILWKLDLVSPSDDHFEGLVGIDIRYQQIKPLLCIGSPDVRIVGLLGMGGIGKTTIARVLFQLLSSQFESSYFLKDVREKSAKGELDYSRKELLSELLEGENLNMSNSYILQPFVRRRLKRKRVLVVFDDVDKLNQFKRLVEEPDQFGRGSRIIVTTRDEQVLRNINAHIHKLEELNSDEALQLFHLNAFRTCSPTTDYSKLSQRVVNCAKGIPLALEVMGSLLYDKSKEEWESQLSKLKTTSNRDILNVLRISYETLDDREKDLFLDIACFFKGEDISNVQKILDCCGFCVDIGISTLKDKSLITVYNNRLEMHDLIQEMAWEIVREQCFKEPGNRTRLWIAEDVVYVLKNNRGTEAVEGIFLNVSDIREVELNSMTFSNMRHLRLLKIYNHKTGNRMECKVCLPQGLEHLPDNLRYLFWEGYPLKSLPSKFCPEKLVELSMTHSQLEQLWDGVQYLGNLRKIDLSYSVHLTRIPNLSMASNLESINFEKCTSLLELPSYFQYLNKVTYLNLRCCSNLQILLEIPPHIEYLDLCGTAIEDLDLCGTAIEDLPSSSSYPGSTFKPFSQYLLGFRGTYIRAMPLPIEHLTSLINLDFIWGWLCPYLEERENEERKNELFSPNEIEWDSIYDTDPFHIEEQVQFPYLGETETNESFSSRLLALTEDSPSVSPDDDICDFEPVFPKSWFSLCNLDLSCCAKLQIPDCLGCLSSLQILNLSGSNIECIPTSIKQLCKLYSLDIRSCKSLKSLPDDLPWFLQHLDASGCTSLEKVPSLGAGLKRRWDQIKKVKEIKPSENFIFFNCPKLDQDAKNNIMDDAQLRILRIATLAEEIRTEESRTEVIRPLQHVECFQSYRASICCPGSEIPTWFKYQTHGSYINLRQEDCSPSGLLGFAVCAVIDFDGCSTHEENCLSRSPPCVSHFLEAVINNNNHGDESYILDRIVSDGKFCSLVAADNIRLEKFREFPSLVAKDKIRLEKSSYLFQRYYCVEINVDPITEISFRLNPVRFEGNPIDFFKVKKYGIRPLYAQDAKNVFNEHVGGPNTSQASSATVTSDDDDDKFQSHSKRLRTSRNQLL